MISSPDYAIAAESEGGFATRLIRILSRKRMRPALVVAVAAATRLAVTVSTHYANNIKLLVGLVGGLAFILLTMRWPEFGILALVALMSGLVSLTALPLLHLGPVSLHIGDLILLFLLSLVFLRATRPGFTLFGSPLTPPLLLFIGAFLLSAVNGIMIEGVSVNTVLRQLRPLCLWMMFVPTLQLVRDKPALRRLLTGLLVLSGVLLIGVLFPNKLAPFLAVDEVDLSTGGRVYSGFTRLYYAGDMILYAMLPVTVATLAMVKQRNQLWRVGLLGLLLIWAFRTGYRQFWLTLLLICVLIFWFLSTGERLRLLRRMTPAIAAAVLLLGTLTIVQPNGLDRIGYVLTDRLGSLLRDPLKSENSLEWRVIETRYALLQFNQRPLLGVGLANSFRPPMAAESEVGQYDDWTNRFLENGYLWIAVMMGLVGLLPFLWLCVAYLVRVFRHQREIRDDGWRAIYLGFGAAFLGMVACNVVTPTFVIGSRLVFFPIAMAVSETILRLEREKSRSQ